MKTLCKALFVLSIALVVGCGSSNNGGNGTSIVGTWKNATISRDGQTPVTCPGQMVINGNIDDTCGANDTITFNANGTYSINDGDGARGGTYTLANGTLTLTMTTAGGQAVNPPVVEMWHIALNGNTYTAREVQNNAETGKNDTWTKQ